MSTYWDQVLLWSNGSHHFKCGIGNLELIFLLEETTYIGA